MTTTPTTTPGADCGTSETTSESPAAQDLGCFVASIDASFAADSASPLPVDKRLEVGHDEDSQWMHRIDVKEFKQLFRKVSDYIARYIPTT